MQTIFKSIKFALTGKSKLKNDVKRWIDYIFLEFSIGGVTYTSFVDNTQRVLTAKLCRVSLVDFDAEKIRDIDVIFDASSKEEFSEYCEKFFYKKLGIASLKWTQKDSRKDVNKLNEAGTSWVTFFKTIYLESKDTQSLVIGSQSELLVQILFGLGLTASMNRLKIKKELLQFETSVSKNTSIESRSTVEQNISDIESELRSAEIDLLKLRELGGNGDIGGMIEEKSQLVLKLQDVERVQLANIRGKARAESRVSKLFDEKNRLENEWKKLEAQKHKLERNAHRIKEHIEIGSFFSNLDIKSCPSCNCDIGSVELEPSDPHDCGLCHRKAPAANRQEDVSRLENTISDLDIEIGKMEEQLVAIQNARSELDEAIKEAEAASSCVGATNSHEDANEIHCLIRGLEGRIEAGRSSQVSQ